MFSLILVNLWLGYPYMFLVSTGALQSIPTDLKEAALVDGANGWKAFRKITFPLLLVTVSPLLIASFAFNFNNFALVWLLTNGNPRDSGESAGYTDILLSWTYRVALDASPQRQALAAALSVIIFVIVAVISAFGFKYTKTIRGGAVGGRDDRSTRSVRRRRDQGGRPKRRGKRAVVPPDRLAPRRRRARPVLRPVPGVVRRPRRVLRERVAEQPEAVAGVVHAEAVRQAPRQVPVLAVDASTRWRSAS